MGRSCGEVEVEQLKQASKSSFEQPIQVKREKEHQIEKMTAEEFYNKRGVTMIAHKPKQGEHIKNCPECGSKEVVILDFGTNPLLVCLDCDWNKPALTIKDCLHV